MKKLEDYIHLYLGVDVMVDLTMRAKLIGVVNGSQPYIQYYDNGELVIHATNMVKLLLRPLGSMTVDEAIAMYDHLFPEVNRAASFKAKIILDQLSYGLYYEGKVSMLDYIQWFKYLLDPDRAFDIFGLIPAGLALDSTLI